MSREGIDVPERAGLRLRCELRAWRYRRSVRCAHRRQDRHKRSPETLPHLLARTQSFAVLEPERVLSHFGGRATVALASLLRFNVSWVRGRSGIREVVGVRSGRRSITPAVSLTEITLIDICLWMSSNLDSVPSSAAPVIVVGGGQSGLAAAHALRELRMPTVILEASDRPTGSWPRYYDSLQAFSPAGRSEERRVG